MRGVNFPTFEAAFSVAALHRAMLRALKGHRGDEEAAAFLLESGPRLCALSRSLTDGRWRPAPYRTFPVRDPKPRMVAVVDFADRVVHHALVSAVESVIDPQLDPDSFACRKGKGLHRCVERAQELLRNSPYHLGLDIEGYFRETPHETVLTTLRSFGTPEPFVDLFARVLAAEEAQSSAPGLHNDKAGLSASPLIPHSSPLHRGMCIGALTSQFLGNVGLHPVESMLRVEFPDTAHVRYMDDIVVFGASKRHLWEVHEAIQDAVESLGLRLKTSATRLAPATEGLSFCGYRVYRSNIRLRRRSVVRLGRRIKSTERRRSADVLSSEKAESSVTTRLNHAATADTLEWRKALVRRLWP
jgi:RNA-directed DNA polymerase